MQIKKGRHNIIIKKHNKQPFPNFLSTSVIPT